MPFTAIIDRELTSAHQAEEGDFAECPTCGEELRIRESHLRAGVFVARHFWHPTSPLGGCSGPGSVSAEHRRMKSIAASKAESLFTDAAISIETTVANHRADVPYI